MGLSPYPLLLRQVHREATEDDDETGEAEGSRKTGIANSSLDCWMKREIQRERRM